MKKFKSGFTLIELLIVIGIIAILAAIIYVAVDPARRFQEAKDAERWSSVNAVLNAVLKYTVDSRGTMPAALTAVDSGTYQLGTGINGCSTGCTATTTADACVDLGSALVPDYLAAIPSDPSCTTNCDVETDYYIYRASSGRITVGACDPERASAISVTR